MGSDNNPRELPGDPGESIEAAAESAAGLQNPEPSTPPATPSRSGWRRRTFLQAAALGTAAAALISGNDGAGLGKTRLGPLAALAAAPTTDPGTWQCTANDVNLVSGQALNVPCSCSGSFNARVQFTLVNNTGTNRYCVAVYLPATAGVGAQWVLLNTNQDGTGTSTLLPGTQTLYGTVAGFPCGVAQITFTNTTVAWQTTTTAATCTDPGSLHYSKSQCEHQTLSITGYGATLSCASASCGSTGSGFCTVSCGGTLYLQGTAAGASQGATPGKYTWTLKDKDGNVVGGPITNASSPQCFTVSNPTSGPCTLEVVDSAGCKTTASVSVTVNSLTAPALAAGTPACDGTTAFTLSSPCPGQSGATYTLQQVGDASANPTVVNANAGVFNTTAACPANLSVKISQGTTTYWRIQANNSSGAACNVNSATQTVIVPAALGVSLGVSGNTSCNGGVLTFTASGSGGTAPYSFSFQVDGGTAVAGTGAGANQFTYSPKILNGGALDASSHTVKVTATDKNGCPATATKTVQQCITSTVT